METRRILLDGVPTSVVREGDELVAPDGRVVGLDDALHLAPVEPTKIICVHLNYESRRAEFGAALGPAPTYFHKPVSALNGHGGDIVRPPRCRYLNYEGEIAIVIDTATRHIAPGEAAGHIRGYTIANDFGLHDFRDTDAGSMLRVKGSDSLCPLGPGLVTGWDFRGKAISTRVNGQVAQAGTTDEMIWDMHYLVADIARTITLEPGDVLLSGTPANSRPVEPGDVVEVEVEGLGTLRNTIVEGSVPVRDDVGAQPSGSEEVISTAFGGDWEFRGSGPPAASRWCSLLAARRDRSGATGATQVRDVRTAHERDAWWRVAESTVGSLARVSFDIHVSGEGFIPRRGGALLAYNHVSVIDAIFVAIPVLRRDRIIRCFALSEDFERPVMGRVLNGLRQIPIRRGAGAWDPLEEMAGLIRDGWLGGIAPEGTVGTGQEIQPIQKGSARIALLAGCPVIPVGVWGAQRRYPKAGLHLRSPARPAVGVAFGPPIEAVGDAKHRPDVQALTDRLRGALIDQVDAARRLAPVD